MKNVALLTIDCLRKDALGCYGNRYGSTPFLDSIAEQSIQFTRAQTIAPYTQASFPGILTSSYYWDHTIEEKRMERLSPKRTIVSEVLKRAGVATAAFHSNPYLGDYFGWNRGWDKFYDSMEEDDVSALSPFIKGNVINQMVDEWLSSHVSGGDYRPFFLWTHYMDVHEPYVTDKQYLDVIDPTIDPDQDKMLELFQEVVLKRDVSNVETVNLLRKLYLACVREVDDHARVFFDVLGKHGVLEETVVIITADHGDEFGEHGALSHNGKMYGELIDSPLLIYNHNAEPQSCDTLVSALDVSPTIVHLFGLQPIAGFQGQSLLPLKGYPRKGCYGEAIGKLGHRVEPTDKPVYSYREDDLKIIYRVQEDSWEMYDLESDPKEQNNIVHTSPLAEEMRGKLRPRIDRAHG